MNHYQSENEFDALCQFKALWMNILPPLDKCLDWQLLFNCNDKDQLITSSMIIIIIILHLDFNYKTNLISKLFFLYNIYFEKYIKYIFFFIWKFYVTLNSFYDNNCVYLCFWNNSINQYLIEMFLKNSWCCFQIN